MTLVLMLAPIAVSAHDLSCDGDDLAPAAQTVQSMALPTPAAAPAAQPSGQHPAHPGIHMVCHVGVHFAVTVASGGSPSPAVGLSQPSIEGGRKMTGLSIRPPIAPPRPRS